MAQDSHIVGIRTTLNPGQLRWLTRCGATVTTTAVTATAAVLWQCKIVGKTLALLVKRSQVTIS